MLCKITLEKHKKRRESDAGYWEKVGLNHGDFLFEWMPWRFASHSRPARIAEQYED
jgi:hypothetical protein